MISEFEREIEYMGCKSEYLTWLFEALYLNISRIFMADTYVQEANYLHIHNITNNHRKTGVNFVALVHRF